MVSKRLNHSAVSGDAAAAPFRELWLLANVLWRGYMRKALRLAKMQIETPLRAPGGPAISA